MLRYNFNRIFKARGIDKPFAFLHRAGFSQNFASKINQNKPITIRLNEMEKLCIVLNCTPNDFYEWTPDNNSNVPKDHLIHNIKKPDKIVDITKTLSSIPIKKLDEIEQIIKNKLKAGED